MSQWNRLLFGAVSVDLLLRVVLELSGAGTVAALSAVASLASRYVLALPTLVWAYGWLLLSVAVFEVTPAVFPKQSAPDWTASVLNRVVFAGGAVATGITLEGWLARAESSLIGTDVLTLRVFVPPTVVPIILVGVLVGYRRAKGAEKTRLNDFVSGLGILYTPRSRFETGRITVDRYILAVLLTGILLSTLVLLFPLPELVVVALQIPAVVELLRTAVVGGETTTTAQEDLVKSFTGATSSIWGNDVEELFHVMYVLLPLGLFAVLAATVLKVVDFGTVASRQPVALAVLGLSLFMSGTTILLFALRLSERIRARKLSGGSLTEIPADAPPRYPLFLLPAGLLFVVVVLLLAGPDASSASDGIITLRFTPVVALTALAGFSLAVVTVRLPETLRSPFVGTTLSDPAAAAIGTVVVTAGFFVGLAVRTGSVPPSLVTFVPAAASLYIGPRVFLGDDDANVRRRLVTGLKRALAAVVLGGIGVGVLLMIGGENGGGSLLTEFGRIMTATIVLIGIINAVVYVLVLPFYFITPEDD